MGYRENLIILTLTKMHSAISSTYGKLGVSLGFYDFYHDEQFALSQEKQPFHKKSSSQHIITISRPYHHIIELTINLPYFSFL